MELEVQKVLRGAGVWETGRQLLEAKYGIKAKQHGKHPQLWLLKYDQIESPFEEQVVRECRGLILDVHQDYRVVAHPYHKFFNLGEQLAAQIDWASARAYEKLDGSLITLYHYAGEWQVATSGTPDANTPINDFGVTFGELFWKTFKKQKLDVTDFWPWATYMFELVGPLNRVVVPYPEAKLYLHGARDLATGQEWAVGSFYLRQACEGPKVLSIDDAVLGPELLVSVAGNLDPLKHEGWVVVDKYFNRVKIKSPRYVAIHHAKDTLSRRRIADLIRMGEGSEFLAYFPQLQAVYDDLKADYDHIVAVANAAYAQYKAIPDQKAFALAVKHLPAAGALFMLRAGKVSSVEEWMRTLTTPAYHRLLGVKDDGEPLAIAA